MMPQTNAFGTWGPTSGEVLGVKYFLRNGLLDLHPQEHQAKDCIEQLQEHMKRTLRKESADIKPEEYAWVHRMARMCWELKSHQRMTNLDRTEVAILYDCPLDERFEWVFQILNYITAVIRNTSCSIVVADHVAKCVEDVMTS